MSAQLDLRGADALRRLIESRGIARASTGSVTTRLDPDSRGNVARPRVPRRRLRRHRRRRLHGRRAAARRARARRRARRAPARRRADRRRVPRPPTRASSRSARSRTSTACASGSSPPGYAMAEVAATRLLGGEASFPGYDLSTKLKLSGVDVASFGDAFAETPGALDVVYADPVAGVYKKLVLSDDAQDPARRHPRRRCVSAYGIAAPAASAARSAATRPPTSCPRAASPRSRPASCPTRRSCARATA